MNTFSVKSREISVDDDKNLYKFWVNTSEILAIIEGKGVKLLRFTLGAAEAAQ